MRRYLFFEGEEVFLCIDSSLRAELAEFLPPFVLDLDTGRRTAENNSAEETGLLRYSNSVGAG